MNTFPTTDELQHKKDLEYIKNDTPLGLLMKDFVCTEAKDIHYRELADKVKYYKEDEGGVSSMCRAMEEMRAEAAAKAKAEGKADIIAALRDMGIDEETLRKAAERVS